MYIELKVHKKIKYITEKRFNLYAKKYLNAFYNIML